MSDVDWRRSEYSELLAKCGQSHLLAFWSELDGGQREQLLDDLDQVDFPRCTSLIEEYVTRRPVISIPGQLEPAETLPPTPTPDLVQQFKKAREAGENAIRDGRVAAFTVAGGQGTRLGYDGPKGGFEITPIRSACLFQVFAESLLGTERKYGARPRWYIMTSPLNHDATIALLEEHNHFGLSPEDVFLFPQRQMPAFLPNGQIALAEKHRIALGPDGHGGSLRALAESGALADMKSRGIEHISYFQVDNPLVRPIDPLFVGLHIDAGSEMSSKAVTKAHDLERVGNFCLADGRLTVIEYSDMPEDLALAKNDDGSRKFDAGSVAIHVLDRGFVERLTGAESTVKLPWHRADKKLPVVDTSGNLTNPDEQNVVKLEMFVFDAIPLANNPIVLYTPREEEFSPVKNAEGTDSPATTRRDMLRRAARWLEQCGVDVPRDGAGEPAAKLEISPVFALDVDDLRSRLDKPPVIRPGQDLLLD